MFETVFNLIAYVALIIVVGFILTILSAGDD